MSKYQTPIHDNLVAGSFLNKHIDSKIDFTQLDCWYIGNPVTFAFSYHHHVKLGLGYQGEITVASRGHKFTKKQLKKMFALFFENKVYNNYRLIALINPDNQQAIKMANLCNLTLEGRLRKIDGCRDRLIFSLLIEEYKAWVE